MKEMLVRKLNECGFVSVTLENGVVMTLISSKDEYKKMQEVVKEMNYNGSWGVKYTQTSACN